MKNIFKFHYSFYIIGFITLITGFFKPFLFINLLILIHEFGHVIMGLLVGYRVNKIIIYPCGGLTLFDYRLNGSIMKELLVVIMGPIFQIIGYLFIRKFIDYYSIHVLLLIFNLLPIYPLDGSKILILFFQLFIPFKKVNKIISYIGFICCLLLFLYFFINFNFIYLVIIFVIFFKLLEFYKNGDYLFNLFVLERYYYCFNFRFKRKIDSIYKLYRSSSHLIYNGVYYESEKSMLKKRYKND